MAECMLTRSSSNSGGGGGGGVTSVNGQTGAVSLLADDVYAVSVDSQSLTTSQQQNARNNIGAAAAANLPPIIKVGTTSSNGGDTSTNTMNNTGCFVYGSTCDAYGNYVLLFGTNNGTYGNYSVAIGDHLTAVNAYEWAIGKYNQSNANTVFSFGDGTSSAPHNLMELKTNGTLLLNGNPVAVLSTLTGYDATKTQTLKNVNGTFTWVDDT